MKINGVGVVSSGGLIPTGPTASMNGSGTLGSTGTLSTWEISVTAAFIGAAAGDVINVTIPQTSVAIGPLASAVPEPSCWLMSATGVAVPAFKRRTKAGRRS